MHVITKCIVRFVDEIRNMLQTNAYKIEEVE
jgi:hypothetical protein